MPNENAVQQTLDELLSYRCPRYDQLPDLTLYSDQVVDALNQYTAPLRTSYSGPLITPTMINNYVKQKLIDPPVKRRYNRDQIAHLYAICVLKQVFSISEIAGLLEVQKHSYPFPVAYNYFCTELELAIQATFSSRDFSAPSSASLVTAESELVRSSAITFAHKLFTAKFLQLYDFPQTMQPHQLT